MNKPDPILDNALRGVLLSPSQLFSKRNVNEANAISATVQAWLELLATSMSEKEPEYGQTIQVGKFAVHDWQRVHELALEQLLKAGWTIRRRRTARSTSHPRLGYHLTFHWANPKPGPVTAAWPYPTGQGRP